jgi:hypothetical protein
MATSRPAGGPKSPASLEGGATQPDGPGADEVRDRVTQETEQGFRGVEVDPTPNEHYAVGGVIAGKPTPETTPDPKVSAADATRRGEPLT